MMLADMAIATESSRAMVWRAATAKDSGDPRTTYYASIAKVSPLASTPSHARRNADIHFDMQALASQHAVQNANLCVQIHGGAGYK